jgi:hypothetical protein
MPQIRGIKGEAVVVYRKPLITKKIPALGEISLCSRRFHRLVRLRRAFLKGKQNGIFK